MSQKNRVRKLINLDIKKEIISKRESRKSVRDLNVCSYFSTSKDCLYLSNLYVQCIKIKLILYYLYTCIFYFVLYFFCLNSCVGWQLYSRLRAWNVLHLNTYISMYARTNRCYNERFFMLFKFTCTVYKS